MNSSKTTASPRLLALEACPTTKKALKACSTHRAYFSVSAHLGADERSTLRTSEGGASFTHAGWKPISAERMVDDLLGALLRGERVDA